MRVAKIEDVKDIDEVLEIRVIESSMRYEVMVDGEIDKVSYSKRVEGKIGGYNSKRAVYSAFVTTRAQHILQSKGYEQVL